jgi:hypothetical protein
VLLQAGRFFLGGHFQDAVQVQIALHDQLVARRNIRQPRDTEIADAMIEAHILVLALVDLDLDFLLVVMDRGEHLAARGG